MINQIEPTTVVPGLERIEASARLLRKIHDDGIALCAEYEAELLALEKRFAPRLRRAADNITEATAELIDLVEAAEPLFEKPRTRTFFGIRVGFMKQRGEIRIEDEPGTIARIEKLMAPKEAAGLIKTTKKLVKTALGALPGDVLKKLGVQIAADTDAPFLKVVEGDAVKRMAAMIGSGEE